jgi:hypothetical protein
MLGFGLLCPTSPRDTLESKLNDKAVDLDSNLISQIAFLIYRH